MPKPAEPRPRTPGGQPDEPQRLDALMRHLGALATLSAARTHRPGAASRVRETGPTAEPGDERAETLMTSPAITVQPDTTVSEAAWLVPLARLKRVPVAKPDGRLVGTVHRNALLDALLRDDASVLQGVRGRIGQAFPEAADTVEVTVREGVARLRGDVTGDEAARLLAEVKGLEPVTDVVDELTVWDRCARPLVEGMLLRRSVSTPPPERRRAAPSPVRGDSSRGRSWGRHTSDVGSAPCGRRSFWGASQGSGSECTGAFCSSSP
ncbi:CBS domain-containing protein [Streptomyces sp. NPDC090022]|uniref:CBS domain-containing protein n=1 Tax=Streptomyces sp. NPDC090022 TaxID=3365920 RepID=UPI00383027FD